MPVVRYMCVVSPMRMVSEPGACPLAMPDKNNARHIKSPIRFIVSSNLMLFVFIGYALMTSLVAKSYNLIVFFVSNMFSKHDMLR